MRDVLALPSQLEVFISYLSLGILREILPCHFAHVRFSENLKTAKNLKQVTFLSTSSCAGKVYSSKRQRQDKEGLTVALVMGRDD